MTHYTGILFFAMALTLMVMTALDRDAACVAMIPVSIVYAIGVIAIHRNKVSNHGR